MRQALAAHPDEPIYIADEATRTIYLLVEKGKFPELEEAYIRERLEEGFAAIERGEVEDWDSASIKAEGRRFLQQQQSQQ